MRQDELASLAGIAVSTLSMYENGLRTIPDEVARKIADALGCDISAIFSPVRFEVRGRDVAHEEVLIHAAD